MEKTKRCDFCSKDEALFPVFVPVMIWDYQLKSTDWTQEWREICYSCIEKLWEAIGKIKGHPDKVFH
ncbi:MAG TPA: hypothetical protein PLM53_20330 [Spirochaetota bacterium]|nr:hypothetical protein [Spirochaetota bacterium]HQH99443.1 hypothetical protein [Spirochaetota bacterium]